VRIAGLAFTILTTLVLAAPAGAATVELQNGTLRYAAGAGERNQVDVVKWIVNRPDDATGTDIWDSGARIAPGPGCTGSGGGTAHCDGPVSRIEIFLEDGDDWAQAGPWNRTDQNIATEVHGGSGNDEIHGGHTTSAIYGEDGDDQLEGGAGNDVIDGGPGQDDLRAEGGDDVVLGGDGVDVAWGGAGSDRVEGGEGLDELFGWNSWGSRPENGPDGNDTLIGGPGPDYLDGEGGADDMSGGADVDTLRYLGRTEPLSVTLDDVANDGAFGENDLARGDIENLLGSTGPDVLVGNGLRNRIDGGEGDDTLSGGGAYDELVGGIGNDALDAREPAGGIRVGRESVDCGDGSDSAQLDGDDEPYGCEAIERNGRPAGEQPEPEAPVLPTLELARIKLASGRTTRTASASVTCTGSCKLDAQGTLRLKRGATLSRARVKKSASSGRTTLKLKLKLSKAAQRRLKAARRPKLQLVLKVAATDAQGKRVTKTVTRDVR